MNVVVEMIADSWDDIRVSTLRKSWRKIVPMRAVDPQTNHKPSPGKQDDDNEEFVREFQVLGVSLDEDGVCIWLESDIMILGFS